MLGESGVLTQLLGSYGYAALFAAVALESCGIPLPGEVMLILAAVDTATSGRLSFWPVLAIAFVAAVIGDNLGYLLGRFAGWPIAHRYGRYVGLGDRQLTVGRYLFARHGGAAVFLGRFVAVLRAYAGLLAGLNRMPWRRFVAANAAGGLLWATAWVVAAHEFGAALVRLSGPLDIALAGSTVIGLLVLGVRMRSHWTRLVDQAERELT